jgi:hypothetical protein
MAKSLFSIAATMIAKEALREQRALSAQQNRLRRQKVASERQLERDRRKQAERHKRELNRQVEEQQAREDVDDFEKGLEDLVSLHRYVGPEWDWKEIINRSIPESPRLINSEEMKAKEAESNYVPGFFTRLLRLENRKRDKLKKTVEKAREKDADNYRVSCEEHLKKSQALEFLKQMGTAVLSGNLEAYESALIHLTPFKEMTAVIPELKINTVRHDVVVIDCVVLGESVIPNEEKKLTASGKLSVKKMPAGRYWAYYQDYVCSCALRVAREVLALLPVPRIVVNIASAHSDKKKGNKDIEPVLAISIPRQVADMIDFQSIDPSDSLKLYSHRMKFKKTSGFEAIEPIHADESFITTGPSL